MVRAIPPGGNWKSIPSDIPSARLAQIRATFAAGNGSRSTYYGRLRPDMPSFTISTCINRPGNGCYIHFDASQDRLISQREAARLQSFPDWFVFHGNRSSVNKQIGNAVPPLLAYHVARALPHRGQFVDLFSGAGGLSLGFKTAGWTPLVAVDLESSAIKTYDANIHPETIVGSLDDGEVFQRAVEMTTRSRARGKPLYVIGGPPCQGLSTAGNRRSLLDPRNSLFLRYSEFLRSVRPDGFVFENVPGILTMDHGRFIDEVVKELSQHARRVDRWVLNAAEFGVPQRRQRVFLVGSNTIHGRLPAPVPLTPGLPGKTTVDDVARSISVREALDDLPPLRAGQDGSDLDYLHPPAGEYQSLMRGVMSPVAIASLAERTHASSTDSRSRPLSAVPRPAH